ncbi:MAG: sodium-translocating pyrophosphatase [Terriglobales bacterium]
MHGTRGWVIVKTRRSVRGAHPAGRFSVLNYNRLCLPALRRWGLGALCLPALAALAAAQSSPATSDAQLVVPSLHQGLFLGVVGSTILAWSLVICVLGLLFGLFTYVRVRDLPVHVCMREVSELIWETCKTYLITQGKFLAALEALIAVVILIYFGYFSAMGAAKVATILAFSVLGILGSYAVAWYGIRVNTFANSRTAFASLRGKPYPVHAIPLRSGMSIGMVLISLELAIMLLILLFIPGSYAGPCFIGFAIGESLGAAVLRVAGGIFTKIADIGADLMKIVFNVKEDDARNPGVIADCAGDNAGDSVGPSADGFETYGVTAVALITFIVLAVKNSLVQVQLLVWIFALGAVMLLAAGIAYFLNHALAKAKYQNSDHFNFEKPLTSLVWISAAVSIVATFIVSWFLVPVIAGNHNLWWELATVVSCGTLAGAVIPEVVKVFTSTESRHVREVVISSEEGGSSLNILSGIVAGNFSAFWLGFIIMALMGLGYWISTGGLSAPGLMDAPAVFAFGLVAFGFLSMGPVTIAVDSYGPVADNAQSVYELSLIEHLPGVEREIERDFGFRPDFELAKRNLEENDGAGNTFKATAKPVLIGTAVVGVTTLIFSIVMALTHGMTVNLDKLSILYPPFLLGLLGGGAVIYWFGGAATQAVTTGAYRAVEFIKCNIRLDSDAKASIDDSKKVVAICTRYAQKGLVNIFIAVFFFALAFAFAEPFLFIGYLVAIAFFGLYQAIFMANAGGAWDNAKKIVETEMNQRGTDLHAATVVGDTVGDPFKDTSSVALNPIIKFTTLFGLLAVELAVSLTARDGALTGRLLAVVFFAIALVFVWRSFYSMRIDRAARTEREPEEPELQATR